jgi:hypothetical protein
MGINDGTEVRCPERQRLHLVVIEAGHVEVSARANLDKAVRDGTADRVLLVNRLSGAEAAHNDAIDGFYRHRANHEC